METVTIESIASIFYRHTFNHTCELDLQNGVEQVLRADRVDFRREVVLGPCDRIDFMVGHGIGVEIKVKGTLTSVSRQIHRYLGYDTLNSLVLVTTISRHQRMPPTMRNKIVNVCYLSPLF